VPGPYATIVDIKESRAFPAVYFAKHLKLPAFIFTEKHQIGCPESIGQLL
jgi:hypothetical protein